MAKRETWSEEKKRVQVMSEADFTKLCRERHAKYEARVKNSEDSIPFWEYYSEQCSDYGRTPSFN